MGMKWSSCFVWICILLIRFYQYCISPLFPGHCRFVPSCSSYALEAFQTHGVLKGFTLTVLRLSRCHPGCKGGYDPVPPASRSSYLRNH